MIEKKDLVKTDPTLLHTLPFSASWKRKKEFTKTVKWGDITVTLESPQTINAYDLVTLLQLLKKYIQNSNLFNKVSENLEGKSVIRCKLKPSDFMKERGLENDPHNRESFIDSLFRWKGVDYTESSPKGKLKTSFIYEVFYDKIKDEIEILLNEKFFDFCISKKGLAIDFKQVLQYKSPRTILLDLFIQSTKWNQYHEDLLYEKIGLNDTDMRSWDKRDALRKCFHDIKLHANLDFTYENGYWTNYTQICDS